MAIPKLRGGIIDLRLWVFISMVHYFASKSPLFDLIGQQVSHWDIDSVNEIKCKGVHSGLARVLSAFD